MLYVVASLSGNVLATVTNGECFKFNGGVKTADGYTWYELQNVHNHAVSISVLVNIQSY